LRRDVQVCVEEAHADDELRVLIVTGAGRGFCSGADVSGDIPRPEARTQNERLDEDGWVGRWAAMFHEFDKPVIAAINGIAAGAGSVIALASDFRLLARSAAFAFLFTKVGLAGADMGSAYLLPRLVGLGRATELLLLGDKVGAEQAERIGLATSVVDDDALPATAAALARRLADGPALAYSTTKVLLTREQDLDLGGAIELEAITQALLMTSKDHHEFYAAWSEGRTPRWSGR
jgi:enoyl-CoA hydratase/carnithine racemase